MDHRRGREQIGIGALVERVAVGAGGIEPVGELEATGPQEVVAGELELEVDPRPHAVVLLREHAEVTESLVQGRWER